MNVRRLPSACLATLALLLWSPVQAHAQGLDGMIRGTVKDAQGGVLAGASVRLTSPALTTLEQRTTTDDKGQFLFAVLPPGQYAMTVELAPTFDRYSEEAIRIGAGEHLTRAITLKLAGVVTAVTVDARTSLSRGSGMDSRFGSEYFQFTPSRRFSMFGAIGNAFGVSPTAPASGSVNTFSIFGSGVNEHIFMIDGTNFTCPCQGVSRAEPITDVIKEVHVQSIGGSVEYGNFQGGVINVVTKQGGARFSAEMSYYAQHSELTSQPIVLPIAGTQATSGYERERYRDLSLSLGGPIKRDRLWFFGAYQYLRDYDSQPGANPIYPRKYENNKYFGKLTWRFTPNLHMTQSFHEERWVNPTPPTVSAPFETTQRVHAVVPNMTFASITHVLSNRTLWEARVGRFTLHQDTDPSSGDFVTPHHRDLITGLQSGNAPQIVSLWLDRVSAKAVLHRYQTGWLGTDHELKTGVAVERGLHRKDALFPGGVQYNDQNSAPFQAIVREPWITGGNFVTFALFASESFSLNDRLTIDAGLRYDYSDAINPDLSAIDAQGNKTSGTLPGIGTVYTWNVLSPRLGLRWKLDQSGRTFARATYGRFYQGVLTGELDPISQGATPTTTWQYEAATGGYTKLISRLDPKVNQALDPDTRPPHTDEFSVAIDREITPLVRASVAYVGKRGRDYLGWTDIAGEYREETRTLSGGTVLPVFVLTNSTADRRFLLTNPDLFMNYHGLVVAAEKRFGNNWQASGSYTFSRSCGLQVVSNGAVDVPQFSTIASPDFLVFGQDPNDLTNATGRLPNDRPHVLRASGMVRLPWKGVMVAANLQHYSGKPWASSTQVSLPQGSRKILLETRGTRRLSSQSLLDLRVSKTVQVGNAGTVDLLFDVLNALDDTAEEALVSENPASASTFGKSSRFIDPRRVMLGVRLNLGK
jgi:Carboxypeptidase regulatory-like domain/TonB dependent receptor-like, beta-barrel